MTRAGFPHSDTPGSQLGCQLPRAYRRLQRPSSALDAKASTMCPSKLVSTTSQQHTHKQQTFRCIPVTVSTTHSKDNNQPPPQSQQEPAFTHCVTSQGKTSHTLQTQFQRIALTNNCLQLSEDARVHYADLKQQPHQHPHPPHTGDTGQGGPESPATRGG